MRHDSLGPAPQSAAAGDAAPPLEDAGYEVIVPDRTACCGLTWTGSSGWHPPDLRDVTAVVQPHCHQSLRAAQPGTVFIADGFSCRTQVDQLAGVMGVSLAELWAGRLQAAD